jgi:hypothetical protein
VVPPLLRAVVMIDASLVQGRFNLVVVDEIG